MTIPTFLRGTASAPAGGANILVDLAAVWEFESGGTDARRGYALNAANVTITASNGKIGNNLHCPGVNCIAEIADANGPLLRGGARSFTLAAWVRPTRTNGTRVIAGRYDPGGSTDFNTWEYDLILHADAPGGGNYGFRVFTGGSWVAGWATGGLPTSWSFVVGLYDLADGRVSCYHNGANQPSGSLGGGGNSTAAVFRIGDFVQNGGATWEGHLDQICFWQRALTTAERDWMYNNGVGRTYAQMVAGG